MLSNNHVQIVMGVIGVANEARKSKGKKFLSGDEMLVVEKKVIYYVNKYNRFENFIVNNKVSIFIKELFYRTLIGVPYPEYLFSDNENDYLVDYKKGKTKEGKVIVEFTTSPTYKFALDVSKMWVFKKYYIKYIINKTSKEYKRGTFRFKRILIYQKKES